MAVCWLVASKLNVLSSKVEHETWEADLFHSWHCIVSKFSCYFKVEDMMDTSLSVSESQNTMSYEK